MFRRPQRFKVPSKTIASLPKGNAQALPLPLGTMSALSLPKTNNLLHSILKPRPHSRGFKLSASMLMNAVGLIGLIMDNDGEPTPLISELLSNTHQHIAFMNKIENLSDEDKHQLFYSIASGYNVKFGMFDKALAKEIFMQLIVGDGTDLKIEYGLACCALHKESELAKVILEALMEKEVNVPDLLDKYNSSYSFQYGDGKVAAILNPIAESLGIKRNGSEKELEITGSDESHHTYRR